MGQVKGFVEGLAPEQRAAATAPEGRTLVAAGAGTGKTTTLAARVAWLISERGVPARSVMAVTFTNRAARELRERIEGACGPLAEGLRVGTFHGLSARLLRRRWEAAGLGGPGFSIADEDDARSLMAAAAVTPGAYGPFTRQEGLTDNEAKLARKEWESGLREFCSRALRQVSLWKAWGLTDGEACDPARPERDAETERLARAYGAYQYELESRNMVDFGDLLLRSVSTLKNHPSVLEAEAGAVRHLLVDEGQDANPVQVEWARLMSSANGAITVVGDEDQNIYGFQGGYPGAMQDMAGPARAEFSLTANRRCTEEILRPANLAVDYNRRREPKVLSSGRHGAPVTATGHPTDASEAAWTAARIAELIEGGADPSSIAVLFRTSHAAPAFEEALARKGVPAEVTAGRSLLDREEARDVIAMVRLAVNPYDDLAFVRLAARTARGLGSAAIEAVSGIAVARGIPFHEACLAACDPASGAGLRKDGREAAARLGKALYLLSEEGRWNRHPYDMITIGLEQTGYAAVLEGMDKAAARFDTVEAVHRLAEAHADAPEFLQELSLLTEADASGRTGRVRLATMHSVKGLEFDHVFCPAFDDGVMPNQRSVEEGRRGKPGDPWDGPCGGGVEEERRLAHVAFTRARHTLSVSFAWKRGTRRGKGGGPSSFVEECELDWSDVGPASTASLGITRKRRKAGRVGFDR